MRQHNKDRLFAFLVFAVTVYFSIALYGSWHNCSDAGGTLVRGLFWFECVP